MNPSILVAMPTRAYVHAWTMTTVFSLSATPGVRIALATQLGSTIAEQRNKLVKIAIERGDDYILFVDSDSQFGADALQKMIDLDKDIVGLIYVRTSHPYQPNISELVEKDGKPAIIIPKKFSRKKPFRIFSIGTGTMLIKVSILKAMAEQVKEEWFKFERIEGIKVGEDTYFCYQAQKAGYEVWCDPTILTKHWNNYGFSLEEYDASNGN